MGNFVLGLDYGTDSVRAVLIDATSGDEIISSVHWYQRWKAQKYCDPTINQYRQHPSDHIEGMEATIKTIVAQSKVNPNDIKGICIDTTGSSPLPVDKDGHALAMLPDFAENPNAMMVLWKDHTSVKEAEMINHFAKSWGGIDYTKYVGGIYSSEWFWAKIWHIHIHDEKIANAAYTWMEHCDFMTYTLIEDKNLSTFKRSRCAAGHKAMWSEEWNGLPSTQFLDLLHPSLSALRSRLYEHTFTSDQPAGNLSSYWAEKLGLSTDTIISVGTFDAHAGAVGANIEANTLVRVMGTSTCDIIVAAPDVINQRTVRGICGQVDGSVIPGVIGLEAGQSGFGDVLAWWKDIMLWPIHNVIMQSAILDENQKSKLLEEADQNLIASLTHYAQQSPNEDSLPIALDWINGRRTPDADQSLKSAINYISLGTTAPHIFKALIYAICFGSKKIVDRFEAEGIVIDKVVGIGGVARKSPYIMQLLADTLNKPIYVAHSDYAPALGAAIYAACASGLYADVTAASQVLGSKIEATYSPNHENVIVMANSLQKYNELATFVESLSKQ